MFDFDSALKKCLGNRELLNRMVDIFYKDSVELLDKMHQSLRDGDFDAAGRAAHRLKGTIIHLDAQPAAEASAKVEQAAKSGQLAAPQETVLELEQQVELLKSNLSRSL